MLTYYLRKFRQDCRIDSIQRIRESISNINDEILLEILEGKKKVVTEDGRHFTIEEDHDEDEVYLSRDHIQESFEYKFMDLASLVMGYSKGLHFDTDEDRKQYYSLLKNTFEEIHKLEDNWKEFCVLIKCNINVKIEDYLYDDNYLEADNVDIYNCVPEYLDSPNKDSSYKDLVSTYLSTLNFSFKYAIDYLIKKGEYEIINLLKTDLSNGLNYIPEHKTAQLKLNILRGDTIFPEDILECIWNSGWLSPNGELYGCSDFDHINFSDRLVKYLNLSGTNSDRILETNGYIKFSCGRWLYMEKDFTPTIAQLETILKWNKEKNKSLKICIGDGLSMVNVDIIESKLNSLNK